MSAAGPGAPVSPGAPGAPGAPAGPSRGPSPGLTLAVAAAAGAGVMSVELAAVRLLAPWFGTSAAVWTNVIGVILLALSIGYLLGARCAAGPDPARALVRCLALGGGAVCLLPVLAAPVAELFLPEGMSLEGAADLVAWGSLASTGMLFLVPATLLGAVGPLVVELVQARTGVHAGTAGGRVLCVSTLGSLAGTFATTHLFLPGLGTRWTLLGAGAVLLAAAALLAVGCRRAYGAYGSAPALVGGLALGLAGGALGGEARAPTGMRVLEALDSPYQSLRVVEPEEGASDAGLRLLQVNEGLDSFQSVWSPRSGLLGPGYYYDTLALPLDWIERHPARVLVLGLGAGTCFRVLAGLGDAHPVQLTGVELDPSVVALGRRHFDLDQAEAAGARVLVGDARVALRTLRQGGERFDLVILDCYANQSELPPHLVTREMFAEVREVLSDAGVLAINVGAFGADDPVLSAVGATLAAELPDALAVRVPASRNWVLFGGALPTGAERPGTRRSSSPLDALLAPLTLPGSVVELADVPGLGPLLTDDQAPTAQLQRRSLRAGDASRTEDA